MVAVIYRFNLWRLRIIQKHRQRTRKWLNIIGDITQSFPDDGGDFALGSEVRKGRFEFGWAGHNTVYTQTPTDCKEQMPYITGLLKNIADYSKMARTVALRVLAQENLYQQLVDASKEILNPDVAYTIQILAEMYKKALEINGGFNVVYRTIQGITDDLDPEEPEQLAVENLLNRIGLSIRAKAANPDKDNDLRILQQTAADAKRNLAHQEINRFDESDPDGDEEQEMSAYEAALTGYQEAEAEKEEGFGGEEKAKEQFDFTGGVSPEEA